MIDESSGTLDTTHIGNGGNSQLGMPLQQGDCILHTLHLDIAGNVGMRVFMDDGGYRVLINTHKAHQVVTSKIRATEQLFLDNALVHLLETTLLFMGICIISAHFNGNSVAILKHHITIIHQLVDGSHHHLGPFTGQKMMQEGCKNQYYQYN